MNYMVQSANLSNWTLSLVLGVAAALRSGSQAGYVDELPLCDVLLTLPNRLIENGASGANVVIGLDTRWIRMMIMSFHTRKMPYSYILLKNGLFSPRDTCNRGEKRCLMTPEPHCAILPNMFYSLVTDETKDGAPSIYKAVHRPECILAQEIDGRAIEFLSDHLVTRLKGITNIKAMRLCARLIDVMCDKVLDSSETNDWDRRIIGRIRRLAFLSGDVVLLSLKETDGDEYGSLISLLTTDDDGKDQEDPEFKNETMDRIHARIPNMLERLQLKEFEVKDEQEPFSIYDVSRAFIIFFGIARAVKMSHRIYNQDALVAMGYNSKVAHQLISDVSEVPAPLQVGYSSEPVVESTEQSRLADIRVDDVHVFYTLALEVMLSVSIMIFSGMGPITCMYVGRLMTARYRGSALKMGTSLNWSVSRVQFEFTGSARDDWMVCVTPSRKREQRTLYFTLLVYLASFAPIIAWPFFHPDVPGVNALGHTICYLSFAIAIPWVMATETMQLKGKIMNSVACSVLVSLVAMAVVMGLNHSWLYLYLFELVYTLQWVYGAIKEKWLHQGSALLMLGVLGALRLSNLDDM